MIPKVSDRKIVTYGVSPQADVRAQDIEIMADGARFDVVLTDRSTGEERTIADLQLPMLGDHNVSNALAAIAIARELEISEDVLRDALAHFKGVKRRFTKTGETGGVTVIDDYAHHPVEIAAVLGAARDAAQGKVIAVVQPHRYTRLRDLFDGFCTCFNDADTVIVSHVHPAGEQPIEGFDRDALVAGLQSRGHRHVLALDDESDLAATVRDIASPGDMVICLGAGSITGWAQALPARLAGLTGVGDGA